MKLIINTDGGARGNPGPAGIGVVISNDSGQIIGEFNEYIGEATNNVAEYKALILGLQKVLEVTSDPGTTSNKFADYGASKLQVKSAVDLEVRMDSELIVRQMQGRYKIKEPTLQVLASQVMKLKQSFKQVEFVHVRREFNKLADALVNKAIDANV